MQERYGNYGEPSGGSRLRVVALTREDGWDLSEYLASGLISRSPGKMKIRGIEASGFEDELIRASTIAEANGDWWLLAEVDEQYLRDLAKNIEIKAELSPDLDGKLERIKGIVKSMQDGLG